MVLMGGWFDCFRRAWGRLYKRIPDTHPAEPMIVIDPGHPSRPGDTGVTVGDFQESEFTFEIALQLVAVLDSLGITCELTRGSEEPMSLFQRGDFSSRVDARLVISIHANAHSDPSMNGLMVFYRPGAVLAKKVADAILKAAPHDLEHYKKTFASHRKHWARVDNVLKQHECPAVLVECGFASNDNDREALQREATQAGLVAAMLSGVARFLELNGE